MSKLYIITTYNSEVECNFNNLVKLYDTIEGMSKEVKKFRKIEL